MVTKLEKFAAKQCCVLCNENHTNDLLYGAVYKLGRITVHYFCLLLSTDMVQRGKDKEGILGFLPQDIQSVVKKSALVSCKICQRGGATVRCSTCRDVFHLPCGIRDGSSHQFYGQFKSFCPKHRIQQNIPKEVLVGMQCLMCSICLENAELDSVIWAPCCKKNGFFHKSCLQRMAYSFGSYTLKCPLCNDRKKFVQAVEYHGIYVPQQDASWEVEPNAFNELLERYKNCDAKKCICPKGRQYSRNSSTSTANWKILLCVDCGSQGVHYKCFAAGEYFKCDVCNYVESASQKTSESQSLSSHMDTRQGNESEEDEVSFAAELQCTIIGDQNSLEHPNFDGSVNGDHSISENITNTTNLNAEKRLQNSRNSSNTRSEVKMCVDSNNSDYVVSVNGDHKTFENINTTDSKIEIDVDKDHQNSRNFSNTTPKVEICVIESNQNSNKSTTNPKIQNSSVFLGVEKRNSPVICIPVEDKMDIDSENNNSIYPYQCASSFKRHANGESIQKETSFVCESATVDQSEEEKLVKRRRIEEIATASEAASSKLIFDERISSRFHSQQTPRHHQQNLELEGFEGSREKQMIVCADDHGKHLEVKLKKTQKYAVTVRICEGRAEECLNYVEKTLNQADVSVIICGSRDIAKNRAEKYISALKRLVTCNRNSKFVIVDLPVRYDRPDWSFINANIRKTNEKLSELFENRENVSMVYLSEAGRKHHTIYGRHLDYYGKIWLTNRICWAANLLLN